MPGQTNGPEFDRESHFAEVLAEFFLLRDAGMNPDPKRLIRDHPEISAELEEYFRDEKLIEVATPLAPLRSGSVFGGFEILEVIARRDSGGVFKASRVKDGLVVALKVLSVYAHTIQADRARFRREVEAIRELDHPCIVPLIEAGEVAGVPFLAMPFLEGVSLSGAYHKLIDKDRAPEVAFRVSFPDSRDRPEHLTAKGPRARAVAMIGVQVARALGQAHARGILHRDVKPGNLMLDTEGRVFLTDFGLAFSDGPDEITRIGELNGTPSYMGPERFADLCDRRSDVYSLGITLYELLLLRRAFPETASLLLLEKKINRGPKAPRRLDRTIPRDLETIILVATQPEPADRYKTADALADDLLRFLQGRPILARRPGVTRRLLTWTLRHKLISGAAVILLASLLGMLRFSYLRWVEYEFQTRLFAIQKIANQEHHEAWSTQAWRYVREAASLRHEDRLRDEAAATLIGLDLTEELKQVGIGGSGLAFDRAEKHAILGGSVPSHQTKGRGRAVIWSIDEQRVIAESQLTGPGPVAFSSDDTALQLLDQGRAGVVLWDVRANSEVARLVPSATTGPRLLALSADATRIAVVDQNAIMILDRRTKAPPRTMETGGKVTAVEFSPDGEWLAIGYDQGNIRVEPLSGGGRPALLKGRGYQIQAFAFQNDVVCDGDHSPGLLVASGDVGGVILIHELQTGTRRSQCLGSPHEVTALAFSPDGMTLASAGSDKMILWDHFSGRPLLHASRGDRASRLVFSRDGRRLGLTGVERQGSEHLTLCSIKVERGITPLMGLSSTITGVVFSPDNRLLAAFSHDWTIGVWDVQAKRLIALLRGPAGYYADNFGLTFGPDGETLAVCTGTEAQLWNLRTKRRVRQWQDLPPGIVDRLRFLDPNHLLLLRCELRDPLGTPKDDAYPNWPKVIRVRNLLGPDHKKPLLEIAGYRRVNDADLTLDGRFAAVHGVLDLADPRLQSFRLIDIQTGKDACPPMYHSGDRESGVIALDPTGIFVLFVDASGPTDVSHVLEIASGRERSILSGRAECLGPGATTWVLIRGGKSPVEPGHMTELHQVGANGPFLRVALDGRLSFLSFQFGKNGRVFVWGQEDGLVLVCDMDEVNARLREVGLGR